MKPNTEIETGFNTGNRRIIRPGSILGPLVSLIHSALKVFE